MELKITGKNVRISDAMEKVLSTKLGKLDKFFEKEVSAKALVSASKNLQKIEVTIPIGSGIVRAEVEDADLYDATDMAVEKLARQIRKNKEKLIRKGHDTIRYENIGAEFDSDEDIQASIVRRKRLEYKPMSEEEAVMQMELLGHDFFLFHRAEDDVVCLLYLRRDGDYGIIEQE